MAVFNQSEFSNLTNITEVLDTANTFSSGTLGIGIWILVTFGSIFLLVGRYSSRESIIASSFISFVSALFLNLLGLLSGDFVIISLVLVVIGFVMALLYKGSGGTPI